MHIFCNKCDLPTKASLDEIKKDLEVELTDLRKSYLASEDNCDKDIMDSENDDAAFTFDDALCDVSFSTGSVRTYDMNDLLDFIKK